MDDGGGGYVVAQPGPINDEVKEPVPLTCIEAAGWCLLIACCIATTAAGIVVLFVWPSDSKDVPAAHIATFVVGFILLALGSPAVFAFLVRELVTRCRESRQIEAMTRLHVVPVSRR